MELYTLLRSASSSATFSIQRCRRGSYQPTSLFKWLEQNTRIVTQPYAPSVRYVALNRFNFVKSCLNIFSTKNCLIKYTHSILEQSNGKMYKNINNKEHKNNVYLAINLSVLPQDRGCDTPHNLSGTESPGAEFIITNKTNVRKQILSLYAVVSWCVYSFLLFSPLFFRKFKQNSSYQEDYQIIIFVQS